MADLSYIDQYFNRVVRGMSDDELNAASRAPASEIKDPNSVLKPLGASMPASKGPQVEPTTEAEFGIINPTPKFDFNSIAENYRKNEVSNILGQESLERESRAKASQAQSSEDESRKRARQIIDRMNAAPEEYKDNPSLLASIEDARKRASADTSQPRDIWSEVILSLGPAVLGGLSGDAGKAAQLPAGREARAMFEGRRKEAIEQAQKAKENAQKQYELLLKIKTEQREAWDKTQQRKLDQLKTIANSEMDFYKADTQRVNEFTKEANRVSSDIAKMTSTGNKEYAELAGKELEQQEKNKRATIIAQGQDLKRADTLRKEFQNHPVYKNFQDVQQSYSKIEDLAKNPSAAGDISMIFSYMKMLDPGSVVREGEQATAQNAAGIPDKIRNMYNRAVNGERLTPEQRSDFINQARSIYNSQQSLVSKLEKDYTGLATQYGTSSNLVVPRPSAPIEFPKYVYKQGARATISNKQELEEALGEGWAE